MRPRSREILHRAKKRALLLTNLTNIRYMTGVRLSAGMLLVLPRSMILFVDGRYAEMAKKEAPKAILINDLSEMDDRMATLRSCGIEADDVTVGRMLRWKKRWKNTKFVPTHGVIEYFRRRKSADELALIRKAEKITAAMLRRVPSALRVGMREIDLAWKLELWARELGAEGLSFDAIVGFGSNTSRPHHHPTVRTLKKGDLVQIDVGAKYDGYCADRSAVYFTGSKTPRQKKALQALTEAKEAAKKAAKKGASVRKLDGIARSVLQKYGMEGAFTHSLGHGVGLDIHEGITLSRRAPDDRLLKHEVITIEPGVYFEGEFGMRLEDMVVVM